MPNNQLLSKSHVELKDKFIIDNEPCRALQTLNCENMKVETSAGIILSYTKQVTCATLIV